MKRRKFVLSSAASAALTAASIGTTGCCSGSPATETGKTGVKGGRGEYNGPYSGKNLDRLAFPLGGIGAGMICLEGTGALSHFSLHNMPQIFNEPLTFSAICIRGKKNMARVLEGPVPSWKVFGRPNTGNGAGGTSHGLPRYDTAEFTARFPFASIKLTDSEVPLDVEITGWSPFVPNDADNSSLPTVALEYTFRNRSGGPVDAVYSFNAINFMAFGQQTHYVSRETDNSVKRSETGFLLSQQGTDEDPWREGAFCAETDSPDTTVNCSWFRGSWWDPLTIAWKNTEAGEAIEAAEVSGGRPSPGGSLYVPFKLAAGEERKITLRMTWYVPKSKVRTGREIDCGDKAVDESSEGNYSPWYSRRFAGIDEVISYWKLNYADLKKKSRAFSNCFYDTDLPAEVVEAAAANLTILKSPTVLRVTSGKLWCWEGCSDNFGCCAGTCTHVWNYAQAIPHLFPELERSLRHTEFFVSQSGKGHQMFRSSLPIRCTNHEQHAASDGQLGGIMKAHREWRISGDAQWLGRFWPRVKQSLDYCIKTWDPRGRGVLEEPHHNTYDIEFWGPDGMCSSFYLGALKAASIMGDFLGQDTTLYKKLYKRGRTYVESELFNGEYFVQKITTEGLNAKPRIEGEHDSPEAAELLKAEGPMYQYGEGCLSDGVLGDWIARCCGVGPVLDPGKVASHLISVHKYNFKTDLTGHANPQRPTYAMEGEAGLLLCSWPHGGELSLPFVYSNEVWTGIEYQVASHLAMLGQIEKGLDIVRGARDRYDGAVRNPFNEYECGHWYARALASYGLFQGLGGVRYDAVEKTLFVEPSIKGDFRHFLCTATGWGTAGVRDGKAFFDVKEGSVEVNSIERAVKA